MANLRKGLYGLSLDELEEADRQGLSAWQFHSQVNKTISKLTSCIE